MTDTDESADWLTLLQEARANLHGISQTAIADRAGVSMVTLVNTLKGRSNPRPDVLRDLVAALMPIESPQAQEILARHERARGVAGTDGPALMLTGSATRRLMIVLETGLADIAAAIREGHKT